MSDPRKVKYVVALQCQKTKTRCSGFFCENAFANREDRYSDYPADAAIRFISMDCGGCPGNLALPNLRHLQRCLKKNCGIGVSEVVVHLSSCMALSNYHSPACPHLERIRTLVERSGFRYVEGTRISPKAEKRRQEGVYE